MISSTHAGALLLVLFSQAASGEDRGRPPCDFVDTSDLGEIGYRIDRMPARDILNLSKGQADAPVDTHSEMCTFLAGRSGDRMGLQLTVDTFAERVSEAQLANWTKLIMKDDKATFTASKVGDSNCETGEFELIDERTHAREGTQHFVSCDVLDPLGNRRVSLYFQAPEDKALLPSTTQVKAMLDKITGKVRMQGAIRI